ncbi:MAG: hypothetical protein ACYC9Z_15860 [Casimicrobiaceae bacterium]
MARRPNCRRSILTSIVLGCWMFAVFISAVHACDRGGARSGHLPTVATQQSGGAVASGTVRSACEQFSVDNLPVAASRETAPSAPDQQAELAVSPFQRTLVARTAPPMARLDRPDPRPGIALYARFLRLAL